MKNEQINPLIEQEAYEQKAYELNEVQSKAYHSYVHAEDGDHYAGSKRAVINATAEWLRKHDAQMKNATPAEQVLEALAKVLGGIGFFTDKGYMRVASFDNFLMSYSNDPAKTFPVTAEGLIQALIYAGLQIPETTTLHKGEHA